VRVHEPEHLGVKGLSGHEFEAIFHKLLVFSENSTFQNLVATIARVTEKCVAYILHVYADLVGTARFQLTFDRV
jgi:hypothetical protein